MQADSDIVDSVGQRVIESVRAAIVVINDRVLHDITTGLHRIEHHIRVANELTAPTIAQRRVVSVPANRIVGTAAPDEWIDKRRIIRIAKVDVIGSTCARRHHIVVRQISAIAGNVRAKLESHLRQQIRVIAPCSEARAK